MNVASVLILLHIANASANAPPCCSWKLYARFLNIAQACRSYMGSCNLEDVMIRRLCMLVRPCFTSQELANLAKDNRLRNNIHEHMWSYLIKTSGFRAGIAVLKINHWTKSRAWTHRGAENHWNTPWNETWNMKQKCSIYVYIYICIYMCLYIYIHRYLVSKMGQGGTGGILHQESGRALSHQCPFPLRRGLLVEFPRDARHQIWLKTGLEHFGCTQDMRKNTWSCSHVDHHRHHTM